jgi:hypothetical protein
MKRHLHPAPPAAAPPSDVARFLKLLLVGMAANGLAWGALVTAWPRRVRTAGAMPAPRIDPPVSSGSSGGRSG